MTVMLRAEGLTVNRKRVQRLMRLMGIAALGPKPKTTKPAPGHKIYPYLLRDLVIDRPNQVWAADITYIPMAAAFCIWSPSSTGRPGDAGLAAVEHDGRRVLHRRPRRGAARFGRPEIFNTDQGSQFTSAAFTGRLADADIRISMDGRGRWLDNVFIERLWRSLKYEEVYLKGYADGREAHAGIAGWIGFYNGFRPHQALAGRTPMAVWREGVTGTLADNTVDMTLRLDDARASPTCPPRQLQQQQMPRVA